MNNKRIELHCHSCMSPLNGISQPQDILSFAHDEGMSAIAVTDYNTIASYPEFQQLSKERYSDIKVIYGVELPVSEDILSETKRNVIPGKEYPGYDVLVLVRNEIGLKNLYELIGEGTPNDQTSPWVTWSSLLERREGLLLGSAGAAGELFHSIMKGVSDKTINQIVQRYDFLELQPVSNDAWMIDSSMEKSISCVEDIHNIQHKIVELGDQFDIPVVATSDSRYISAEGARSWKVLLNGRGWKDLIRSDLHLRTTEEMLGEFSFLPKEKAFEVVVTNSNKIATMIERIVPIPACKYVPIIEDADMKLKSICTKAVYAKYKKNGEVPKSVLTRLEKELNDIRKYGFAEIYLHYMDIIKRNNLRSSQYGLRGMGASSLVAYLLDISKEDPLSEDCLLFFELFVAEKGNRELDFDLVVDERVWHQVRASLNELEGVDEAVQASSQATLQEPTIEEWISDYEIDNDYIFDELQKASIKRALENVHVNNSTRSPGKFYVIPKGKNKLLPKICASGSNELVYPYSWWEMGHMFLSYDVFDSKNRTFLCRLEEESGVYPDDEDIRDSELINHFSLLLPWLCNRDEIDRWKNMMKCGIPKTFRDVVRMVSLFHGTGVWEENGLDLVLSREVGYNDIITNREDIYEMLLKHGISKERAYEMTEEIRKGRMCFGKGHPEYIDEFLGCGIPEWFVESCKKVRYLFSRAHSAEYSQLILRLLFFKQNYSELFERLAAEMYPEKEVS